MKNNDLIDFFNSASNDISNEYSRIRKKAKEDPGTAGDQGEENWASLLKQWLPKTFHIVTKGRIINSNGETSPQVDVVVLKPEYPYGLLNKKLYLADAVLAAFECKLTLKATDLTKFYSNSVKIRSLLSHNLKPTIYDEIQSPIFYGLLAHSHIWKKDKNVINKIANKIHENDTSILTHPIQMPDLICIADTACWVSTKNPLPQLSIKKALRKDFQKIIMTSYMCEQYKYRDNQFNANNNVKPIATAIKGIISKLSKEHSGLKSIAKYFRQAIPELGSGFCSEWLLSEVFSQNKLKELEKIAEDQTYNFPENWWHLDVTSTL
ncbi:MAG TPA: DUF6602 domain-containing protein [Puia sp.]|nr:DUF6602 domain-containing protein [Puia sp.]